MRGKWTRLVCYNFPEMKLDSPLVSHICRGPSCLLLFHIGNTSITIWWFGQLTMGERRCECESNCNNVWWTERMAQESRRSPIFARDQIFITSDFSAFWKLLLPSPPRPTATATLSWTSIMIKLKKATISTLSAGQMRIFHEIAMNWEIFYVAR